MESRKLVEKLPHTIKSIIGESLYVVEPETFEPMFSDTD
jgi:hypothetical protein